MQAQWHQIYIPVFEINELRRIYDRYTIDFILLLKIAAMHAELQKNDFLSDFRIILTRYGSNKLLIRSRESLITPKLKQ